MDNASKALIMAGGMLLAMLIVALLMYAWSLFSEYQTSQDDLVSIENTAKFNEQFTQYDRKDVLGYEILSLVNKVVDYNYRKSNDVNAKNDEKYTPITIDINIPDPSVFTEGSEPNQLFDINKKQYRQSNTVNQFNSIIRDATDIEARYGGSDSATRLSKALITIYSSDTSDENAIKKFNSLSTNKQVSNMTELNAEKTNLYKYYEYVQFKRTIFKSDSSKIQYDNLSGRISYMRFDFVKVK